MSACMLTEPIIIVCEKAPEIEFCTATNLFYVTDPALSVRRALPPAVMQEAIARAARCYSDFRAEQGADIIRFPRGRDTG
jgi:hypothetical protein